MARGVQIFLIIEGLWLLTGCNVRMANFFGAKPLSRSGLLLTVSQTALRKHDCYSLTVSVPSLTKAVSVVLADSASQFNFYSTQTDCYFESGAITNTVLNSNTTTSQVFFKTDVTGSYTISANADGFEPATAIVDVNFSSFNATSGFDLDVNAIALQPDGKILVGGKFTFFGTTPVNRIARLNSDGTLDTTFASATGSGFDSIVNSIALQSDGKIVVGGEFSTFNGNSAGYFTRLNSSGSWDSTFTPTGFDNLVRAIKIQSDDKILVGGDFIEYYDPPPPCPMAPCMAGAVTGATYIARILTTGNFDVSFTAVPGFDAPTTTISILSDGKIMVGGQFGNFSGTSAPYVARLNSNSTLDVAFTSAISGLTSFTREIAKGSTDQVYLASNTDGRIYRLNSNGTVDASFLSAQNSGFDNKPFTLSIQADGKIVTGGIFASFDGVVSRRIARLMTNGTLDTSFSNRIGSGYNSDVKVVVIQPDGKILVGGAFSDFNGNTVGYLNRLTIKGEQD